MPKLLKIGIVGCGAIGSSLAQEIASKFSKKARVISLYDARPEKAQSLSGRLKNQRLAAASLDVLIKKSDLVIEASSAESAFDIAKKSILSGRAIMIMSVGGIIKRYKELLRLAQDKNARIIIPSGAVCGIDGLKAASCGKINKITLTSRKPAKAFLGVPYLTKGKIRLENIKQDTVIFEGDAFSAIKYFPRNINIAATLSIAGIGAKKTMLRIIASAKNSSSNIHELEIESDSGKIFTRTENVVHPDNPKTSYLAALSAVAALKQILEPIQVGT